MGVKLKEAREAKGMTQEQLAAKSGVSRQRIIAIETNPKCNTTLNTLTKLADALSMTVDQIFFNQDAQ